MIEPRCRAQNLGFGVRQHAEPRGVVEHLQRGDAEDSGFFRSVNELQVLRDEIDVDEPAGGELEVPDVVLALLLRDRPAHIGDVAGGGGRVAWPRQHAADDVLDPSAKRR